MRRGTVVWVAVATLGLWTVGCGDAGLEISPASQTVAVGGAPVLFGASVHDSDGRVNWTLSGPGTLSTTVGSVTTYTPPPAGSPPGDATLTATLSKTNLSKSATIHLIASSLTAQSLSGLSAAVRVDYGTRDIPAIHCANHLDCYRVLGFIHATDRLFQMDLTRRAAEGRASELVGSNGLSQDVFLRTVFTTRDGQRIQDALAANLDADSRARIEAYVAGVNAYITGMQAGNAAMPFPPGYGLLDSTLKPSDVDAWTVANTMAIVRLQQFQLSESIGKEIDYGRFAATFGPTDKTAAWIRPELPFPAFTLVGFGANAVSGPPGRVPSNGIRLSTDALRRAAAAAAPALSVFKSLREGAGSNNWVVDAAHSATGKAMVANDPHLSLNYPSLFHLSHLIADDEGLDVLGSAFPGIPATLIGRSAHVGWGVTVVEYDVTDEYVEVLSPDGTLFLYYAAGATPGVDPPTGSDPVLVVPETYKIRAAGTLTSMAQNVRVARKHGPVLPGSDGAGGPFTVLSMRWTGHEPDTHDTQAFFGLNKAASVEDAIAALKNYATGAQNFVLADDQGHIAYDPHALVPRRPWVNPLDPNHSPWFPIPGFDGTAEWGPGTGGLWIPDDQLPFGQDPPWGYLATANSDPTGTSQDFGGALASGKPYLSFDWDDPLGPRIFTIIQRLSALTASGGKVAFEDMQALQGSHAITLATPFVAAVDRDTGSDAPFPAARALFDQWKVDGFDCPTGLTGLDPQGAPVDPDPAHSRDSAACFLFHTFLRGVLTATFADEAAAAGVNPLGGPAIRALIYMLDPVTPAPATTLCNDFPSGPPHTCAEQVHTALVAAYDQLSVLFGPDTSQWLWGRVHTVQFLNPAYPLVATGFSPGPYARPGGIESVDVATPGTSAFNPLYFGYTQGPNVRWVAEMGGTPPRAAMQLPGLERELPFDPAKPGLIGDWLTNTYFSFPVSAAQITAASTASRMFTP